MARPKLKLTHQQDQDQNQTHHHQQTRQSRKARTTRLPHGLYSLFLVLLAGTGWFASLWQGDGCNYAIVTGPIVDQLDPSYTSTNPITTLELGFDSYRELLPNNVHSNENVNENANENANESANENEINSISNSTMSSQNIKELILRPRETSCILYPEMVTLGIVDSSWRTSRSFAFLGLVLGGAGTTFLACSLCVVFSRVTWRWTGYGLLLAAFFQVFSLVAWFQTQLCSWNDCGWSLGSVSDGCALGIWALAGMMVLCHYPKAAVSSPALPLSLSLPLPLPPSPSTTENATTAAVESGTQDTGEDFDSSNHHPSSTENNSTVDIDIDIDIDIHSQLQTHHSHDNEYEYNDQRRYPNAEIA